MLQTHMVHLALARYGFFAPPVNPSLQVCLGSETERDFDTPVEKHVAEPPPQLPTPTRQRQP